MEHTTDFQKMDNKKKLELYIHIPFCVKKCNYCDFLSMPADETLRRHYIHVLMEEIKERQPYFREYQISTIFFGGGTPSLLTGEQMEELMDTLKNNFVLDSDAEITVECNPGTLDKEKLLCYKDSGINRLSIGLQSACNRELGILGRIHSFEEFLENYELSRKVGFENINLDLIFGLPNQKIKDWEYTLKQVLTLYPEHISAYGLMIEEGTPFYEKYEKDELRREQGEQPKDLPEEETEREMYLQTKYMLEEKGYHRYEISNYARSGKECRHNIGYWQRTPYLGLGLGSSSFWNGIRFSNPSNMKEYLKGNYIDFSHVLKKSSNLSLKNTDCVYREASQMSDPFIWILDQQQQMEEFMFLGLRMMEGISKKKFQNEFGVSMEEIYGEQLQKLQRQGLLTQEKEMILLTEAGIAVSNYVLIEFLLS